jgi:oxygen-independent coproporphyrinogen-3 oxidase
MNKPSNAGLYIHVPFCRTKCPYCAFYSSTNPPLIDWWLKALQREMLLYKDNFPAFETLYLGGGTPTLLSHGQWSTLMESLFSRFSFSTRPEVTVEANPDDVTPDLMNLLRTLGVNRVSLGVQSFHDHELVELKRRHTSQRAIEALTCIKASGFSNLGVDLMYGLPGQTEDLWLATLRRTLEFEPEHISCYQFTIEEHTPFGTMRDLGLIQPLKEEEERRFFILSSEYLEEEGYQHYEISSYSLGRENRCRHNLKYWQHVPYLGLGPSAHSSLGKRRWWNLRSVEDYCRALGEGKTPLAGHETLTEEQRYLEFLMLGLRTANGIDLDNLRHRPQTEKLLKDLEASGLVQVGEGRVSPTREGFLVADGLPHLFSL